MIVFFWSGDTRRSPLAPADPILNHQFFPTPPPVKYPAYPGLYFPPTANEETKNTLKNYDFTIGDTGSPTSQINPVLHYLNMAPQQPARLPTTPKPFFPTITPTVLRTVTKAPPMKATAGPTKANRRSHTTERVPATGRRFPHFPSIEITDNYIDTFTARKSDTRKYKVSQIDSYKTTTRRPKKKQQLKSSFYDDFGSQNYKTSKKSLKNDKSNFFDNFGPKYPSYQGEMEKTNTNQYQYPTDSQLYATSRSRNHYTTLRPKDDVRKYQTTVRNSQRSYSPSPSNYAHHETSNQIRNSDKYEEENKASESFTSFGSSNFFSSSKNDFFSDWGKKVNPSENNIKREIGKSVQIKTTLKPKIKQPENHIEIKAMDSEAYQLKNYRTPVGAYPGMYSQSQNSQGYNTHVTATGYTTATYLPNQSKYTSYPAPNTQTTRTTIYTNTPTAYTTSVYPNTVQPYTPTPAVYQNNQRSFTPTPTAYAADFVTQRSYSPSPSNYANDFVTSNQKVLERGPLRKELSNPVREKKKDRNRFYSGFTSFGPKHMKPHQPAITFLEPSSPSPPDERHQTHHRPVETKHTPARDPGNVFNQPAAFDRFFQFSNFDQR